MRTVTRKGVDFCILKEGKNCMFLQNQKIIARGSVIGNLYKVDIELSYRQVARTGNIIDRVFTRKSSVRLNLAKLFIRMYVDLWKSSH